MVNPFAERVFAANRDAQAGAVFPRIQQEDYTADTCMKEEATALRANMPLKVATR